MSGVGDDVNPCSRTAPCKTFAGAISKTAAGGEISVLDPGGFGTVTITKSISIVSDYSGEAGVLASGVNGITINAAATDIVTLRGLTIDGAGTGLIGINFIQGAALHVQNSVIKNFRSGAAIGIKFAPAAGTRGELDVVNTVISDCGTSSVNGGVVITPVTTGNAFAVFTGTYLENNSSGLIANTVGITGQVHVTFRDSVAAGNTNAGITAVAPAATATANITIDRSASVNNGTGILADGGVAFVILNASVVTGNNTGLSFINSGSVLSPANNVVLGNISVEGNPSGPLTLK